MPRRKPRPVLAPVTILQPYTRPGYWQGHRRLAYFLLGFAAFFYGAFFGFTTIYLLQQMAVPLMFLGLLVLWLLPETGRVGRRTLEVLFFAFLVAIMFWPDYLALALPGLPWITAMRLVAVPLTVLFLASLSQSAAFRAEVKEILNAAPLVWKFMTAFAIVAALGIFVATQPAFTFSKVTIAAMNWMLVFLLACYVFVQQGRLVRFCYLLWFATIVTCVIAFFEARAGVVLWAGHIPSFLKIDNPLVEKILQGSSRSFEGYRVQAKFGTPLELAEFLVISAPFILFIAVTARGLIVRAMAGATVPAMIYVIVMTDSRLGTVGILISLALFVLVFAIKKFREDRMNMIPSLVLMAFPFAGVVAFIASFFIGRFRKMIWGTGMQIYSTEAREIQWSMGMPKVLDRPWGFGFGNPELGYVTPGGFASIDSYYLSVLLETGFVGFALFYGIFVTAIWKASKVIATTKTISTDHFLLGMTTICLINFLVIKSVLSQLGNQPLFFVVLGAAIALLYRIRQADNQAQPASVTPAESDRRAARSPFRPGLL